MEMVFVSLTQSRYSSFHYAGTVDAIKAAEVRSGCRVWCIGDSPIPCQNFISYDRCSESGKALLGKTTEEGRKRWATPPLLRTMAVWDFIRSRNDLVWPILPLDNDILVFSNLLEVCKPLLDYDFSAPKIGMGTTGAYMVRSIEVFEACIEGIFNMIGTEPILNDMVAWSQMYQSGKWSVGDILIERDGGVFDTNMHAGEDRYVMEPSTVPLWGPLAKKLTWVLAHPHFTRLSDGQLVRAHWLHCWGSYKLRTKELLEKAGI